MLLSFNLFNESLGINDSVILAGKKIYDIINSDDKAYYLIPNIELGKYVVDVEIDIKKEKDNGSFNVTESSNRKISIALSQRDLYSTLIHELKHAHRFLHTKNKKEKDYILSQSAREFSNLYDDEFIVINSFLYFLHIDEFEAQYHSMYINLSKKKNLSKNDIDNDMHVKIYRYMCNVINKDNFMDIIFDKTVKIKFLLMLHRNELEQSGNNFVYKNLKTFDITNFGQLVFNIKKFLKSNNIIKLTTKEKGELDKLENRIKKVLEKNSKIIRKKLSRLYLLANETKILNESFNKNFGISDEDLDDILVYILDEFTELSYSIESSNSSGIIKYDKDSFIIDLFADSELYYLEPKIFKLIEQVDAQLKQYGLKVFFSDFGQNDKIYEIVITKIGTTPNVWEDRYYIDENGDIDGYKSDGGWNRTTTKSKYKFN